MEYKVMEYKAKVALQNIDFLNRYRALSTKYSKKNLEGKKLLDHVTGLELYDIFEDIGCKIYCSTGKPDRFLYLNEAEAGYEFSFRFTIESNRIEFILSASEQDKGLVFTNYNMICRALSDDEIIRPPFYASFEDLEDILKIGFGLYLDFKAELIKLAGVEIKEPEKIYKVGIPELPILETIIPIPFHEMANEFTKDFNEMDNGEFFDKYDLSGNIWKETNDFMIARENPNTFGQALIRYLNKKRCFSRYGERTSVRLKSVDNFWKDVPVKIVYFYINDGSKYCAPAHYFAYIPESVEVDNVLGIEIRYPTIID